MKYTSAVQLYTTAGFLNIQKKFKANVERLGYKSRVKAKPEEGFTINHHSIKPPYIRS